MEPKVTFSFTEAGTIYGVLTGMAGQIYPFSSFGRDVATVLRGIAAKVEQDRNSSQSAPTPGNMEAAKAQVIADYEKTRNAEKPSDVQRPQGTVLGSMKGGVLGSGNATWPQWSLELQRWFTEEQWKNFKGDR